MTYTLADAIRHEFERTHPRGKDTLLCVGLCRRRKDRNDFRELPTHGRAASCTRCEGNTWRRSMEARTYWELKQAREKLRTYQRYAARLKLERIVPLHSVYGAHQPTSDDFFRAYEAPYRAALEARRRKWAPLISQALSEAHTDL